MDLAVVATSGILPQDGPAAKLLLGACSVEHRGCPRWLRRREWGPGDAPHQSADKRDFLRPDRSLRVLDNLRPGGRAREVPNCGRTGVLHGNRCHLHPFGREVPPRQCWSNYATIPGPAFWPSHRSVTETMSRPSHLGRIGRQPVRCSHTHNRSGAPFRAALSSTLLPEPRVRASRSPSPEDRPRTNREPEHQRPRKSRRRTRSRAR